MTMFSKQKDNQLKETLTSYDERLRQLEAKLREMSSELSDLHSRCDDLEEQLSEKKNAAEEKSDEPTVEEDDRTVIPTVCPAKQKTTFFLAEPNREGIFTSCTEQEEAGKSIYQLTTEDGITGAFSMLDTPDAIATATISISQFVKPVCKVDGKVPPKPRHAVTISHGKVSKQEDGWKVEEKAVVRFNQ